ncbi:F-box/LRR-repeat protein 3 [Amborella trichopoda]|uniref:F-box/LRR-repeat protein 15-like leucin rich repeat domain-containing protein n=1 Tax=Amborella trichopoda TaxID=13333 RepID=W1NK61_AMBTC|nr:F-box/LRR-repeat protein 3 [Amborella trichopoda]ERM95580.1 hypothetical protein AMTR_s00023p00106320 [Amborella trichopoda]|eukprot:XP_006828164.1 F-box/LRR-repeat protein 3 [Amborella trichopoda]
MFFSSMKKPFGSPTSMGFFNALNEEVIILILQKLEDPLDLKSFSLVCKSFFAIEAKNRTHLQPIRSELLPKTLKRYHKTLHLDLSFCPRIADSCLHTISLICRSNLLSLNLSHSRFFSHSGLSQLILNCVNLVEINLSNGTHLTDSAAAAIAKLKNLQSLRLTRCKQISDLGLGCIAVGCSKLRLLSLKWCLGITDMGIGLVAVKCKEIRSLDLSYTQITQDSLASILLLKDLEDLFLAGCHGINDDGLVTLKKGCRSLKTLDISNCRNVTHIGFSSLINGVAFLGRLTLAYSTAVINGINDCLRSLPKLHTIKLDDSHVTSSGLKAIGECCPLLRELSLSKCKGVNDEGISSLAPKCKELRKLDITCCGEITKISIASISQSCTRLSSLKMECCSLVSGEAFVLLGQRCHFLEEVDFTSNEIDDEGLKSLSNCSELICLKIGICLNITDKGLSYVGSSCSKLRELDLYRSIGIADSGIAAIAHGCPSLEMINMSYCTEITNCSLISLSKCQRLNVLEIRGCQHISSIGLSAIASGCRHLTKLDVKKCFSVDDSGIVPLARSSHNLRQMNLSYCSITDVGLLALASISCLQNMTVLHLRGVSANGLATALLACSCLSKVKLHSCFSSLLPRPLIEHMEARGCEFQWRNKPFQVEDGMVLAMKKMG